MMKARIGIGLESALEAFEVLLRMVALAVRRVGEPHGWKAMPLRPVLASGVGSTCGFHEHTKCSSMIYSAETELPRINCSC